MPKHASPAYLAGTDPALLLVKQGKTGPTDMDRHTDWAKAKQDLSDASKRYNTWVSMPDDMRSQMTALEYRRRRSQARQVLRDADALCRSASLAARQAAKSGSGVTEF